MFVLTKFMSFRASSNFFPAASTSLLVWGGWKFNAPAGYGRRGYSSPPELLCRRDIAKNCFAFYRCCSRITNTALHRSLLCCNNFFYVFVEVFYLDRGKNVRNLLGLLLFTFSGCRDTRRKRVNGIGRDNVCDWSELDDRRLEPCGFDKLSFQVEASN